MTEKRERKRERGNENWQRNGIAVTCTLSLSSVPVIRPCHPSLSSVPVIRSCHLPPVT
jgi:hypothetical protein